MKTCDLGPTDPVTGRNVKPPVGLKPRHIHEALRIYALLEAMERYALANQPIPLKWVQELRELVGSLRTNTADNDRYYPVSVRKHSRFLERMMSLHSYHVSLEISKHDPPFYALIMASMRKADTYNAMLLRMAFPEVWDELQRRYHAPLGALPEDDVADMEVLQTTLAKFRWP